MFLIKVHYKTTLDVVDQYLAAHRDFLSEGYKKNYFVVSGPRNPRVGGVILSQCHDREALEAFLKNDPFQLHGVADYELIEFQPVKYHPDFACFVSE